jgi:hypothetical protein
MSETSVHEVIHGHSPRETPRHRPPVDEHGRRFSEEALMGALTHLVESHSKGLLGTASEAMVHFARAELSRGMLSTGLHIELGGLESLIQQEQRKSSSSTDLAKQPVAELAAIQEVREAGLLTALEAFDKASDPWQAQWSSQAVETAVKDLGVAIDRARTALDARDRAAGGPRNDKLREMIFGYTEMARRKLEAIATDQPIEERRPLDGVVNLVATTWAFSFSNVPESAVNAARQQALGSYQSEPDLARALRSRMEQAVKQQQANPSLAQAVKACGPQLNEVYNRLNLFARALDKWQHAGPAARQRPESEREVAAIGQSLASSLRALREAMRRPELPRNGVVVMQEQIAVFIGDAMRRAEALFPLPPGYVDPAGADPQTAPNVPA